MDAVVRYVDQHIELEPEWESAFNLTIKLQKVIHEFIEWASSDKEVLFECFKYLLSVIYNMEQNDELFNYKYETKKFSSKEYRVIDYDVSKHEVSIHIPVSRLLAALSSKLAAYSISFNDFTLIQNGSVKINSIIEPSLRALVLSAQSNVGLWRRNGYSLLTQVYFYSNIKCRVEMFDRDLQSMQMGASLLEPNEFLVILLNKFKLLDFWVKDSPEGKTDDTKYEYLTGLAEELLQLLIVILTERYDMFIGQIMPIEKLKHEVIHQLCISPMAHSDIVKNVYSDNEINTTELESVLREVAEFKTAVNASAKGTYVLKKTYYNYYSPFFYHYTKMEKTKSEEEVLKNKAEKYIVPYRLPKFNNAFMKIRNLLDSDTLIRIFNCVLKRVQTKSKANSDGQLIRVLYLIGLALLEEQNGAEYPEAVEKFKFIEKLSKQKSSDSLKANLSNAIPLITAESYKQAAVWTADLLEKLTSKQTSTISSQVSPSTSKQSISAAASNIEIEGEKQKTDQKRKNQVKAKAEQRRLKILAKISEMQKRFIRDNKDFFDTTAVGDNSNLTQGSPINETDIATEDVDFTCLGPNQSQNVQLNTSKRYSCILCQEDQEITIDGPPMVLCCYIQHSKVLSKNRIQNIENVDIFDPLFMPSNLFWGIHTTTCGHVMHGTCWQKYVEGVKASESRRHRYPNFSVKQNEYLCPLCETIGNTVIPLFPSLRTLSSHFISTPTSDNEKKAVDIAYSDWVDGLLKTLDNSIQEELQDEKNIFIINPCPLTTITKLMADAVANNFKLLFSESSFMSSISSLSASSSSPALTGDETTTPKIIKEPKLSDETINIIEIYARSVFMFGMIAFPNDNDARMPITSWNNCAYTIQSLEQVIRSENKAIFGPFPSRQIDLLSSLVKYSSIYSIAKNIQNARDCCLKLLAAILPYNTLYFDKINIMEYDLFHVMAYLCFSMPHLYDKPTLNSVSCGNLNDAYIFKTVLQAHCVQIILHKIKTNSFLSTIEKNDFKYLFSQKKSTDDILVDADEDTDMIVDEPEPMEQDENDDNETFTDEEKKVYELFEYLLNHTPDIQPTDFKIPNPKKLLLSLKISLMPFLRCSAIFFNYLTDIPQYDQQKPFFNHHQDRETFSFLCKFLGVSSDLSDLLNMKVDYFKKALEK